MFFGVFSETHTRPEIPKYVCMYSTRKKKHDPDRRRVNKVEPHSRTATGKPKKRRRKIRNESYCAARERHTKGKRRASRKREKQREETAWKGTCNPISVYFSPTTKNPHITNDNVPSARVNDLLPVIIYHLHPLLLPLFPRVYWVSRISNSPPRSSIRRKKLFTCCNVLFIRCSRAFETRSPSYFPLQSCRLNRIRKLQSHQFEIIWIIRWVRLNVTTANIKCLGRKENSSLRKLSEI